MESLIEHTMIRRAVSQRANGEKLAIHWMEPHNLSRSERAALLIEHRRALREFIKQETSASDQSPEPRT